VDLSENEVLKEEKRQEVDAGGPQTSSEPGILFRISIKRKMHRALAGHLPSSMSFCARIEPVLHSRRKRVLPAQNPARFKDLKIISGLWP
jgi:hypothetical protein